MSCDASGSFAALYMGDAVAADITHEPVAPDQIAAIAGAGNPMTGSLVLGEVGGREVGVWEMTPGAMTDIEVNEECVIISGRGEVHRTVDGRQVVEVLKPGAVLQLVEGEETLWVVEETVRKIYLLD